jgi:transposase-like protein
LSDGDQTPYYAADSRCLSGQGDPLVSRPHNVLLVVDETYVKVCGEWLYLFRTIDSRGRTMDFYLSQRRNEMVARRFLN